VGTDDLDVDAAGGERLGGLEGSGNHEAAGHDSHVGAGALDDAPAKLELVARTVDHRRGQATKPEVERTWGLIGGSHRGTGLDVIGWHDHRHSRDGAHEGDVLVALVRGSILAHRETGVRGADLHVEMGVADGVPDLLVRAARGKHREGARKRHMTRRRDAGRYAHEVALGDADIEEALRVGGLELAGLGGRSQIGVENDEVVVLVAELHEDTTI